MDKSEKEKNQIELPLKVADPEIKDLPDVVLRTIFQHLNGRDLSSATMVCRSWRDAADHEKCLRGPYCSIEDVFDSEGDWNLDHIKELTIKPFIGFLFLFPSKIESFHRIIKGGICKLLPINCKIIILFTYGYIIHNEIKENVDILNLNILYALLPQIPNIQLNIVLIPKENADYTEYEQMIEEASKQDGSNGCLMIFCNKGCHCIMEEIAIIKLPKRFSLYGGTVKKVLTNADEYGSCVALLITGSMQTWSVTVQESVTPELIKEKFEIFKEQVKLQKHSIGFVFYQCKLPMAIEEVKSKITIFKEVFPEISLVGCFTNDATYGRDTITYKAELMKDDCDDCSIAFVILTYGDSE